MAVDFHSLMSRNRRNSWLLIAVFVAFLAILGGGAGYLWGMGGGDPTQAAALSLVMAAGCVLLASVSALGSYFAGPAAILAVSRAQPLIRDNDPQLYNVVEEMAVAAGMPLPRMYVINDTAPNAFATGRGPANGIIAITTGLRQKLNRDELQGVIAHEMAHIRNLDIRFAVLMATLVGAVLLLCDLLRRSLWSGGGFRGRSSRSRRDSQGGAMLIIALLAIVLSIVAPLLARILEMAFSRQREYLADASAVELTRNPDGLASALAKISGDPEVLEVANRATAPMYIVHPIKRFEHRAGSIFDSHPPIKDRIQRILSLKVA